MTGCGGDHCVPRPNPLSHGGHCPKQATENTYFSFSISMESRFMSVSLKSNDRLSPMMLKLGMSGGSGAGTGFMGCRKESQIRSLNHTG